MDILANQEDQGSVMGSQVVRVTRVLMDCRVLMVSKVSLDLELVLRDSQASRAQEALSENAEKWAWMVQKEGTV